MIHTPPVLSPRVRLHWITLVRQPFLICCVQQTCKEQCNVITIVLFVSKQYSLTHMHMQRRNRTKSIPANLDYISSGVSVSSKLSTSESWGGIFKEKTNKFTSSIHIFFAVYLHLHVSVPPLDHHQSAVQDTVLQSVMQSQKSLRCVLEDNLKLCQNVVYK